MTRKYRNEFGIKKHRGSKKFFMWGGILFGIVLIGVLIGVFIQLDREFKKNNVGTFEIALSNSGASVADDSREIELRQVKIGQVETVKLSFVLSSSTRAQTYLNDENKTPIENGVYVRLKLTGFVYDIDENGQTSLNSALTAKMVQIINESPTNGSSWRKEGNKYTYANYSGDLSESVSLVRLNEKITSATDIAIVFSTAIVDGSWYDKLIKIRVDFEAIDHLSSEANSWR